MNQKKNENKLNKAGKTVLYTFILLALMSFGAEGGSRIIGVLAVILIAAGVAALAIFFVKKANKPGENGAARSYTTHENSQPRKYDPAEIQDRDSRRRLEQLDSFLKNGIIDKQEYAVLRARYQRELGEG